MTTIGFRRTLTVSAVGVLIAGLAACGSDSSSDESTISSGTGDEVTVTIKPVLSTQEPQVI
ncbi:MAG: hypothetical protein ABW004_09955, partial [Aeromicrobium sp.]